jgi:DNA polymerase I-like protein with 3'-5' exonuclease and polymerase domains
VDWFEQLEDMNRPEVEPKEWMQAKHLELVTEVTLDRVINECIESKLYALDLETTGLDNRVFYDDQGNPSTVDKIVGYCLSPDGHKGYYIPVRHVDERGESHEANVSPSKAAAAMRRLADSGAVAIFHNGKFDQEFLQFGEPGGPIGEWDNPSSFEDTIILAYLRNTRERRKGLKQLSSGLLDMEMIELDELFTKDQLKAGKKNFALLDPTWEPCLWYAAADAICTYLLYKGKGSFSGLYDAVMDPEPTGKSQKTVYKLEKMCLPATRWMERCRIYIDREKVIELIQLGQAEWFDSLGEVYTEASSILGRDVRPAWYRLMQGGEEEGRYRFEPTKMSPDYMAAREECMKAAKHHKLDPMEIGPNGKERVQRIRKEVPSLTQKRKKESIEFPMVYDVTIPAQLGLMLRELGVQGLKTTEKSGQVKTDKATLDRVLEEAGEQFPFMGKVKRFRETKTALGNNLFPIYNDSAPEHSRDGTLKINFNGHKVDTGRFATPQPREKKIFQGQARWNIHSIPATYDKTKPACMLRIREAVAARPGRVLFAIDYAGVELRIVTNISREPLWLAEFFRCSSCNNVFDQGDGTATPECPPPFCPNCGSDKIGDLHTLTALSIYGAEIAGTKQFKAKRQKAKALNFAMCYGGGGQAAMRAVQVDSDEGWRIKRQFDGTYKGLQDWWTRQHRFAERYKFVTTAFGRRYPLPDIDHEMKGFREKAKRNAVNGPVQGTSADITKLAMALVYKLCKKRNWLRRVLMTITIHDELVFEIDEAIAEEAVEAIVEEMTRNKFILRLRHPIPYKCDVEFGHNWTVKNNLTEMAWNQGGGDWTPRMVRLFPNSYLNYLQCGGTPVEGVEPPEPKAYGGGSEGAGTVLGAAPSAGKPQDQFQMPETGSGKPYVHIIHSSKLHLGLMEKVAQVVTACAGRGTQPLILQTEDGRPLYEGPEVLVAAGQFKVRAEDAGF